jgi:flagellar basal-body rod protein FlgG
MIRAMYTAAAGMTAQQTEVDVIANNLANVNTTGFRRSLAHFEDMLYLTVTEPGAVNRQGASLEGLQIGGGARLLSTSKAQAQGPVYQTGGPLDFAIQGDGFFEVEGQGGERLFTRDGHFLKDASGQIVTSTGMRLVPNFTIPDDATDISVAADGTLSYGIGDQNQSVGQLSLVRFVNPGGLSSQGQNLFQATGESGFSDELKTVVK